MTDWEWNKRGTQVDFKSLRGIWAPRRHDVSGNINEKEEILGSEIQGRTIAKTAKSKAGQRAAEVGLKSGVLMVKKESPWKYYDALHTLSLGRNKYRFIIVETRYPPLGGSDAETVFSMREFRARDMEPNVDMFRQIQHKNFVPTLDAFLFEDSHYIVFEHMPCSLHEIRALEHLDELKVAAIVWQVSLTGC